tara:strand:- start:983 stop:1789 length:807 start_codon:yes stop_codon:yes gene_type:complete
MLKKRIIFTLLYKDGFFMQSRNFNLQKVGDINWLEKNYDFKKISFYIDELIIIDVSRDKKDIDKFIENLKRVSSCCFIPILAGGGIDTFEKAKKLLTNGADKVLINTNLKKKLLTEISEVYGEQSIIGGIDYINVKNKKKVCKENGTKEIQDDIKKYLNKVSKLPIGEIYLNSIDKDGTGMGLDFTILDFLPKSNNKSIIISGGSGNSIHIASGLKNHNIDAVATSNLLNFVGDGLLKARMELLEKNFNLPVWNANIIKELNNKLKQR